VAAAPGVALGRTRLLPRRLLVTEAWIGPHEVNAELQRFEQGLRTTDAQLERLQKGLPLGSASADAVEAFRTILGSDDLAGESRRLIARELHAAPWAVDRAAEPVREALERVDDPVFRERGRDIQALIDRLQRVLRGDEETSSREDASTREGIAVGTELRPVDLFHLRGQGLAGLVTESGGITSHTTLLARGLGLPYVLGLADLDQAALQGAPAIVDGDRGLLIIDPDASTIAEYRAQEERRAVGRSELLRLASLPAVTDDGTRVSLAANVEVVADVPAAMELGADGVGLLRTELLYVDRRHLPNEDEQLDDAIGALRAAAGRPVTFRTLDLGSDKALPGIATPVEANPALGLRAIRLSLRNPALFRTQLRALYRASAFGRMRIMFPMISGITELIAARAVATEVRRELEAEGHPFDPGVPIGCMIETPSAAMTTDHLARHSDFFSLGTNDLAQYAFAADRANPNLVDLYHPLHPALLRLLKVSIDAARLAGRPISMCGDMASDPALTWILLGLGLRDLSMPGRYIPAVKSVIRKTKLTDASELFATALALTSEREVEALVMGVMRERFPLELTGADA
jgi:phosphoenolpyruvate-protein phosphotransferase (PTS system enzyme I)